MTKTALLLSSLQHGDSFFPSGAFSFSWGLETLITEKNLCDAETVEQFIQSQLQGRWASFDRGIVCAAFDATEDLKELERIDAIVEAQTLAVEMRDGSHQSGLALLRVHEEIGTPRAAAYRRHVRTSAASGNLNVMQGFLWASSGVDREDIDAVSSHTLCVSLLGAAMRLGVIGHIHTQRTLASLHQTIENIVQEPPPTLDCLQAFTPMAEIAMMRHETTESRLFAN
jgi:urease accessory protein